jgi:hypothetical protein
MAGLSLEVFESLLDLIKQRGISAVAGAAQPAVGGGSGDAATQGPWQRYRARTRTLAPVCNVCGPHSPPVMRTMVMMMVCAAYVRCTGWTPCSVGLGVMNDMPNLLLPRELDYNGGERQTAHTHTHTHAASVA